jgi:ribosomal protein L11
MQALKTIRLTVPAAKAKPSPGIGQALGAMGVNMMVRALFF